MSASRRNRLTVVAAALAVLVIVGALAWSQRPDSRGDDVGSASPGAGSDPSNPADPSTSLSPLPSAGTTPPEVTPTDSGTANLTGYDVVDPTHLLLVYVSGKPACYGAPGTPEVTETQDRVVVRVAQLAPTGNGEAGCVDIAVVGSVPLTLDAPLAGREVVQEGSDDGPRTLPRQSAPAQDPAA